MTQRLPSCVYLRVLQPNPAVNWLQHGPPTAVAYTHMCIRPNYQPPHQLQHAQVKFQAPNANGVRVEMYPTLPAGFIGKSVVLRYKVNFPSNFSPGMGGFLPGLSAGGTDCALANAGVECGHAHEQEAARRQRVGVWIMIVLPPEHA